MECRLVMRIFITDNSAELTNMFATSGFEIVSSFDEKFDMICFGGGADVSPMLYGERVLPGTFTNFYRDTKEVYYWKELPLDFPKVGVCRGAQLGNVLCGGSLWQDVDKHLGKAHYLHQVQLYSPYKKQAAGTAVVNSDHHQMCRLTDRAKVLAMANKSSVRKSERKGEVKVEEAWTDPEAFFYEDFNFLGVQWHPEWGHDPSRQIFFEYLNLQNGM